MARPKIQHPLEIIHEQRLARDRARSQRHRDRAEALRRPSGGKVDRAMLHALKEVWTEAVDRAAGMDKAARDAALRQPVSLAQVGARAVAHLSRLERSDPKEAANMVARRLKPKAPDAARIGALASRDGGRDAL